MLIMFVVGVFCGAGAAFSVYHFGVLARLEALKQHVTTEVNRIKL